MIKQVAELPDGQPLLFTDGSALKNPGPCWAAVVCYIEGLISEQIISNESVASQSTHRPHPVSESTERESVCVCVCVCVTRSGRTPSTTLQGVSAVCVQTGS